jgi:hypothetical protein
MVKEVEVLEDHADFLAKGADILFAHFPGADAVQKDVPLVGREEKVDTLEQRAFAAPGRPDEDFKFPSVEGEGHAVQEEFAPQGFGDAHDV